MKNSRTIEKIIINTLLILFTFLFYLHYQYWISFFTLGLLVIFTRFADLKNFTISLRGVIAEFIEKDKELAKVIKSDASPKEKLEKSQKLVDEIFKLGYQAAGGKPVTDIWNVKILRDQKGNIKGYQYDET